MLRDRTLALLARFLLRILSLLPLRGAQVLGALGGALAWHTGRRSACVAAANLRACMSGRSESDVAALARASLIETGKLAAEAGAVWRWPHSRWGELFAAVEGIDLVDHCQRANKGVMVLAPHFGNWEVLNLFLGTRYPLTAMYDPPRVSALDPIVRSARMRTGSHIVPTDSSGIRGLYRALRRGEIVGILPDQVPDRASGVYAPFFGRASLTMTLAPRIMRRMRPGVFVGSAERLPAGRGFVLRFEPLHYDPHDDEITIATRINQSIERVVNRRPEQYLWVYKRFKRPPPGVPRLY